MEIQFLDVGCGDAIHIRFIGTEGEPRNILIDGGTDKKDIYDKVLKKRIEDIVDTKKEKIDLWIISHIDDDHIGGVIRLLHDTALLDKVKLHEVQFWFNYSIHDLDTGLGKNNLKNVSQGILLRDYLLEHSNVVGQITDGMGTIDLWGVKATILSPNAKIHNALLAKWSKEEKIIKPNPPSELKVSDRNDYKTKIEDFDLNKEVVNPTIENASSIAVLLEANGEHILLTADSRASVLTKALKTINDGKKVKLKYMQVPHHGSRYNISKKMLELVDCSDYIISGDGFNKDNLPNKHTLVKILAANPGKEINFHITQKNVVTESIFKVDTKHTINLFFPQKGNDALKFTI